MDTFIEHLVKKDSTVKDHLINLGIILLTLALLIISCLLIPSFSLLIAIALIWGSFKLITRRNLEYEYICTNGEIDIDKIMNRQSRRRLITVCAKNFDLFEPAAEYTKNKLESMNIKQKIYAISKKDSEKAYIATFHHKGVKTALFFEPNDEIVKEIKKYKRLNI